MDFHDWLIYAWARAQGYQWLIDAQPHLRYRQHAHNQLGANAGLRPLLQRARRMASGWWLSQASLIARLLQLHDHPFVAPWWQGAAAGACCSWPCVPGNADGGGAIRCCSCCLACGWRFLPGRGRLA